ncbi:MAG: MDR family MFS transporter [Thermaerobacter sp.]|nr:MDR family MFS transporter [Thermaerobacter sp.]
MGDNSRYSRRTILFALMLVMALAAMDATIVATAMPSIVRDLGGFPLFPWVFSIYLLAQAAMAPIYGKLADLYGRKPVVMVGTGIFLGGSVLSGLSWNMVALIVFRGIQGLGGAAIIPMSQTLVGDLFSVAERARMQGYLASVWGLSAILGPTVGGLLVQYASWRWIFYINVPIGLAALAAIGSVLHEEVKRQPHTIDLGGAVLLVLALAGIVTSLLQGGVAWTWTSWRSLTLLGGGVATGAVFGWWEARVSEPVLPLWVFRQRMLLAANLAALAMGALTMGLSSYLPAFVQGVLGHGPLLAGFALAAMSIGWPLASSLAGSLYLRAGFRWTALLGGVLAVAAAIGLVFVNAQSTIWQAAGLSFVMGSGLGLSSTALVVAIQSAVPWNRRGVATGSNVFTRQVGSAVGVALFGSLVNATLSQRFAHPPAALANRLPHSLNAAALALGPIPPGARDVLLYVRRSLALGIHRVFVGVLVVALLAVGFEWLMPRIPVSLVGSSADPSRQRRTKPGREQP